MVAVVGATVTSTNPATSTNTSLTVDLASVTTGDLNVVEVSGLATGTVVNPVMVTPTGWVKVGEKMDSNGTPASFVAVYYRARQAGDSGTQQTFSWGAAGQMVAVCTAYSSFDTAAPVPFSVFAEKVASDGAYSIAGTTGADAGVLVYGFANRTGTGWTALTDTARGTVTIASSATQVGRVVAGSTAAGTAFTKTATGSVTSVGVSWAYVVKSAAAATSGRVADRWNGTVLVPMVREQWNGTALVVRTLGT